MPEPGATRWRARIFLLLSLLATAGGLALITAGANLDPDSAWRELLVGVGIGLLPSGLLGLATQYFADEINQYVMRQAISQEFARAQPLIGDARDLGVERIYPNRTAALADFGAHLHEEGERARRGDGAELWIVAISMRGIFFLLPKSKELIAAFAEAQERGKAILRILLVHPGHSSWREVQERNTNKGLISVEIESTLRNLRVQGVDANESVRLHLGCPTVFGMATRSKMLLNPYPYTQEGQEAFSIVVHPTDLNSDIYNGYFEAHFRKAWNAGERVGQEYWPDAQDPPTDGLAADGTSTVPSSP